MQNHQHNPLSYLTSYLSDSAVHYMWLGAKERAAGDNVSVLQKNNAINIFSLKETWHVTH